MAEKQKGLFDHVKEITNNQDPKYWDKLEESDKKTYSKYMLLRFLSMNPDWIELISEIQPYAQGLEPRDFHKLMINLIPKGRHFLKYTKGKKDSKYEKWLVDLIRESFECSSSTAIEYCEILYSTKEGRESILDLCTRYGIEKKQITKLKLKV
jgi:hypothetical protein